MKLQVIADVKLYIFNIIEFVFSYSYILVAMTSQVENNNIIPKGEPTGYTYVDYNYLFEDDPFDVIILSEKIKKMELELNDKSITIKTQQTRISYMCDTINTLNSQIMSIERIMRRITEIVSRHEIDIDELRTMSSSSLDSNESSKSTLETLD
jgi:hypothetical protein